MSTLYQIRHVTRHRYQAPVTESVMEVRKCPLSEGPQRRLNFELSVEPSATLFSYEESIGNIVHHFTLPQPLSELSVVAESLVELKSFPDRDSHQSEWVALQEQRYDPDLLDYLLPSPLVPKSRCLTEFYDQVAPDREETPYSFLLRLNRQIFDSFAYAPLSTQVDSSIDHALESKRGVCQDFAHIMVGIARLAGIPARYVSGYLYHRKDADDRSAEDASHAWIEAYLPTVGWVGFDPTNDLLAEERHIRTCIGRDYRDVPPTRGVYRGASASELSVAVQVHPADLPGEADRFRRMEESDFRTDQWQQQLGEYNDQQ